MTTELIKVDAFVDIMKSAPEALQLNQSSAENAVKYGTVLISKIEADGMSDDLDAQCNDYLVKLKKTCEAMNTRRKPVTQLFDEVKKAFTSQEGQIDQKSDVYLKVQRFRDMYAAAKAEEQRKREAEAARKLAVEREKIAVKAAIEEGISQHVNGYIARAQRELMSIFESATLENFADVDGKIKSYSVLYPDSHFNTYQPAVTRVYITHEDVTLAVKEISNDKFTALSDEYRNTIVTLRDSLIDRLPSKKQELEAMAAANEAEQKRLQEVADKRRQDEADRLTREAKDREEKAKADAELNKQTATANSLFDNQMELASGPQQTAQVREGYEISVKNPIGWMAIFQFWFEREGKKQDNATMEKKTLGSMKTFCEGHAKKTGEVINNPYLEYVETFKAVAKK